MKKAIDITFTVVMVIVLIFAFLLVGIRLFGLKPYTVISGSMEPKYPVGSLIYVKEAGIKDLDIGDPVTYTIGNGVVVTHRIVEIIVDEDNPTVVKYRVKGNANKQADGEPVHIKNVIGKPVFHIPILGYVAYFIQHPPGTYIAICALILFIALTFLPGLFMKKESSAEAVNRDPTERKKNEELLVELQTMRTSLADMQKQMGQPTSPTPPTAPDEDTKDGAQKYDGK